MVDDDLDAFQIQAYKIGDNSLRITKKKKKLKWNEKKNDSIFEKWNCVTDHTCLV